MFCSWEELFLTKVPKSLPVTCIERHETETRHVFTVFVGERPVSESCLREFAFKYALDDLRDGLLTINV